MMPSIRDEAAQALRDASRHHLRFWDNRAINTEIAGQGLDRLERTAVDTHDVAAAGPGVKWALEQAAHPPADTVRDFGALALTQEAAPPVVSAALDAIAAQAARLHDATADSALARRPAVEALHLTPELSIATEREILHDLAAGTTRSAAAFARAAIQAVSAKAEDADPLVRWALDATPAGDWPALRARLESPVSAPQQVALRAAVLHALADGRACTPSARAALVAALPLDTAVQSLLQAIPAPGRTDDAVAFLQEVAAMPFTTKDNQTAAIRAGLACLAKDPPVADLAPLALAAAVAADGFADKSRLARTALHHLQAQETARGNLEGAERIRILRTLADVEDDRMHASPERVWFHAAASLAALSTIAQGRLDRDGLPALYRGLVDAPWASTEYQVRVGSSLLAEMQALATRSGDVVFVPILDATRQAVQAAAGDPRKQAAALVKGLAELQRLNADPLHKALSQAMRGGAPAESEIDDQADQLIIGGVRVPKSGVDLPPAPPAPTADVPNLPPPAVAPVELSVEDAALADKTDGIERAARMEFKTAYERGLGAVFNPATGQVEWKNAYERGVGGAYNPNTGAVEWKTAYERGVAGAYDPLVGETQWQTAYDRGVGGVFNPQAGKVEWQTGYERGVAGVFNPLTRQVEWQNAYERGVAGAFSPKDGKVHWQTGYERGVGVASTDPMAPTLACGSFSKDWDEK